MTVLFRYIARHYVRMCGITLAALVLIYLFSDLFGKAGKFSEHRPDAAALVAYALLRIPRALYEMAPLAALIASIFTVGNFSRYHEVTALRACGVGLRRLVVPIVFVATVLALTAFAANWSLIPTATAKAQTVRSVRIEGHPNPSTIQRNRIWFRVARRTFLNVNLADPVNQTLHGVRLFGVDDHFRLTHELRAPEVTFERGEWMAFRGVERRFEGDGTITVRSFEQAPITIDKMPKDFAQLEIKEEHLDYPELRSYVANLERAGIEPGRYAVDVASRFSIPFICVVMAMIGIPFGLSDRRRGGWGMAVGISLGIALAYWLVYSLAISLGRGAILPPLVAAWSANILFFSLAVALLIQRRL